MNCVTFSFICVFPFLFGFCFNFFSNTLEGTTLFVTAHPDDELMFFGPALLSCEKAFVLSLSRGIPGKGDDFDEREKELHNACNILGIPGQCFVDKKERVHDGFNEKWPEKVVSEIVIEYANMIKPDRIVTFDERGVSFHPNHIAVNRGIVEYKEEIKNVTKRRSIKTLKTGTWVSKYTSFFSIMTELLKTIVDKKRKQQIFAIPLNHLFKMTLFRAFQCHKSQRVWYRYLYLLFSKFQYYNIIVEVS